MFFLRIQSGDISAAPATAVADEVGASSAAAGAGATTSEPLSPRSSHPATSSAPSSLAPLKLPAATSSAPARSPRIHHTRGIIHLYRSCATSSSYASAVAPTTSSSSGPTAPQPTCDSLFPQPRFSELFILKSYVPLVCSFSLRAYMVMPLPCLSQPWRGTCLLVLAVPAYFSPEDFIRFCGSEVEHASDVRFIRDDGVKERYSVLLEFEDQKSADGFYLDVNGWRFSSLQGEICHALFIASVQYTSSYEIASSAPIGTIELPTCPVCIGVSIVIGSILKILLLDAEGIKKAMPNNTGKTWITAIR
ncbi:hypothetical protein EJB05_39924, partial [Eragrostis curvula]